MRHFIANFIRANKLTAKRRIANKLGNRKMTENIQNKEKNENSYLLSLPPFPTLYCISSTATINLIKTNLFLLD